MGNKTILESPRTMNYISINKYLILESQWKYAMSSADIAREDELLSEMDNVWYSLTEDEISHLRRIRLDSSCYVSTYYHIHEGDYENNPRIVREAA
jgi:hypothetical protein